MCVSLLTNAVMWLWLINFVCDELVTRNVQAQKGILINMGKCQCVRGTFNVGCVFDGSVAQL